MRMLIKRKNSRSHEECFVTINWTGVSKEEIKDLATAYCLARAKFLLSESETVLPPTAEYLAKDLWHAISQNDPGARSLSLWAKQAREEQEAKRALQKELDALIAQLPAKEQKLLFEQFL